MALIAHGGPRRITAMLHELAYLVRPHTKPVATHAVALDDAPPSTRHYPPKRARFIEGAAMAREMYRL
jgi:hypothetical protein